MADDNHGKPSVLFEENDPTSARAKAPTITDATRIDLKLGEHVPEPSSGDGSDDVTTQTRPADGGDPDDDPLAIAGAVHQTMDSLPPMRPRSSAGLAPGTTVGEYTIERQCGKGAMGVVHRARHAKLGKPAAIKCIGAHLSVDKAAIARFEQEALALARLSHPNIVNVLTVGTLADRRPYFVMEWLDGESLYTRMSRARISFDEALGILDQIARGLGVAHAAGIVHRDLKPENVWLQDIGERHPVVKILDFGLAKLAEHRRSEVTQTGVMFGTGAYMSPEQCRSSRDVGPETDVYALGCIGFELLCGRLPFMFDNFAELVAAHISEAPPDPRRLTPQLGDSLAGLLLAMLAKDLDARPTLATIRSTLDTERRRFAVRDDVAEVSMAPPVAAAPIVAVSGSSPSRRGAAVLGVAAVLLGLVAVVALLGRRRAEAQGAAARSLVLPIDAGSSGSANVLRSAAAQAVVDAPVSNAGASPRDSATAPIDPSTTKEAVARHDVKRAPLAAATIATTKVARPPVFRGAVAKQPETPARTQPSVVRMPTDSEVRRPAPVDNTRPKTNKNQTFNPFTGQPSSQ